MKTWVAKYQFMLLLERSLYSFAIRKILNLWNKLPPPRRWRKSPAVYLLCNSPIYQSKYQCCHLWIWGWVIYLIHNAHSPLHFQISEKHRDDQSSQPHNGIGKYHGALKALNGKGLDCAHPLVLNNGTPISNSPPPPHCIIRYTIPVAYKAN